MPGWLQKAVVFLLGLAAAALLLEAGFWAAGALRAQTRAAKIRRGLQAGGAVRVLCIGDSMTAGGYPSDLEDELNRRSKKARFTVIDRGQAGVGTVFLAGRLASDLSTYAPNIVILMAGVEYPSIQRGLDQRRWYGLRLGRFAATVNEQLLEKKSPPDEAPAPGLSSPPQGSGRSDDAGQGDLLFAQAASGPRGHGRARRRRGQIPP
ncbi:MAG: hypothetical protein NTY77_11245 [Elusimicrobia bacterium]|nr:hypothetical protein [Elusimicrobiota bacterium]